MKHKKVLPTLSKNNGAISCNDMASAAGGLGEYSI